MLDVAFELLNLAFEERLCGEALGKLALEVLRTLTLELGDVASRARFEGGELGSIVRGLLQRCRPSPSGGCNAFVERVSLVGEGGLKSVR